MVVTKQVIHVHFSGRGILRPCDQYPSEPGVLNSRPVSVLSGYGGAGGHGGSTASRNGDDFQDDIDGDDDDNGFVIKVGTSRFFISCHLHL